MSLGDEVLRSEDMEQVIREADIRQGEVIALLQELVRIPSVNTPPYGDEKVVQEYYARHLRSLGMSVEIYEVDEVPGFDTHPGRLETHDMAGRPNVVGVLPGSGGGRSLLLFSHADVEQPGDPALWTDGDPWSGRYSQGHIFGRGAGDDKCGMAIGAAVVKILTAAGIRLKGDLILASVSDEEQGGANGTVALFAKGCRADASINLDGVNNEINTANPGGGKCTVDFTVDGSQMNAERLLRCLNSFEERITQFKAERRSKFEEHPLLGPPAVERQYIANMTNIHLGTDDNRHGSFDIWLYMLPGETSDDLCSRFEACISDMSSECTYSVQWIPRFLLPSEVLDHPFVESIVNSYQAATGKPAAVQGGPMSDMGMANAYGGYPCIALGPGRWGTEGSVHLPNEYVLVQDVMDCLKAVLLCAMDWCGYTTCG
ncbi:MAG: M20/M25/M40 family metallo-hydrolase [bacterium]|nr:M20/M25/M40 family metallo-hydrolase [bacterium]